MDLLFRVSAYAVIAVLLLWANVWFGRTVWSELQRRETPDVIAPFEVIGKDDAKLGLVLARMLQARLGRIRGEMEASANTLRAAERSTSSQPRTQDLSQPRPVAVPTQVFDPVPINIKVGSVEVGGIVEWVQKLLIRNNSLQLSVQYDGDHALTVGNLDLSGRRTLWLPTTSSNEEIVSGVAYQFVQYQFADRIPQLQALELDEFKSLLSAVNRLAELNRQVALGRTPREEYASLLVTLEALIGKLPHWQPLVRLGAEVAENAGNSEKALALYKAELALSGNEGNADLLAKIDALSDVLAAKLSTPTSSNRVRAAISIDNKWAARVRKLVGVADVGGAADVRIAILGGVPPAKWLPDAQMTVLPGGGAAADAGYMAEYVGTVVDAVRLIAPEAHFVFTPMRAQENGAILPSDISDALGRLTAAKPDVLLVTLGPLGREFAEIFEGSAQNHVLVVLAAGNDPRQPVPLSKSPLLDQVLVASAVDDKGQAADFSAREAKCLWAPGLRIPVRNAKQEIESRNGTSYAAAIAAGVAAHVLAARRTLPLSDVLKVLREGAKPVVAGGPRVLNLQETLAKLG